MTNCFFGGGRNINIHKKHLAGYVSKHSYKTNSDEKTQIHVVIGGRGLGGASLINLCGSHCKLSCVGRLVALT